MVVLTLTVLLLMVAALSLLRPATALRDGRVNAQRHDPAAVRSQRLWWGEVETRPA